MPTFGQCPAPQKMLKIPGKSYEMGKNPENLGKKLHDRMTFGTINTTIASQQGSSRILNQKS